LISTPLRSRSEKDLKEKKFKFGGSTISQQLAKNLFLNPSKNPLRKIKEGILTWRLEKNLSKRRILELYLNVAEWGEGIFGIESAARHYYGISAADLSADQAAHLAQSFPIPENTTRPVRHVCAQPVANQFYEIMVKRGIVVQEYEDVMISPDESGTAPTPPPLNDRMTSPVK